MSATPQQICAGYTNMAAIAFIYAQWFCAVMHHPGHVFRPVAEGRHLEPGLVIRQRNPKYFYAIVLFDYCNVAVIMINICHFDNCNSSTMLNYNPEQNHLGHY
jgi:hypothetical protein